MELETMLSFEPIKPDMYSVNIAWNDCSHTVEMFVCSPSSVGDETSGHQLRGG